MEIIIPQTIDGVLRDAFDTDVELSAWFLAERREGSLYVVETTLTTDERLDAVSPVATPLPDSYVARAQAEGIEILSGHLHSRRYGSPIQVFDPYWTVTLDQGADLVQGQIVDGQFYVSRRYALGEGENKGDTGALGQVVRYAQARGASATRHLFVHPAHGSEGRTMTRDLVRVTCYEFDNAVPFCVKEIPVVVEN